MNITTSAKDFDMTPAIDQFVREQLRMNLQRHGADILAADVFLKDINGPKGGVDKQALIRIRLRNRQVIALETEHEDLYAAVRTGAKRTKRTINRQLRKARSIRRQRVHAILEDDGIGASA